MGFTSHTGISSWLVGKNSKTWNVEIKKKNQLEKMVKPQNPREKKNFARKKHHGFGPTFIW